MNYMYYKDLTTFWYCPELRLHVAKVMGLRLLILATAMVFLPLSIVGLLGRFSVWFAEGLLAKSAWPLITWAHGVKGMIVTHAHTLVSPDEIRQRVGRK